MTDVLDKTTPAPVAPRQALSKSSSRPRAETKRSHAKRSSRARSIGAVPTSIASHELEPIVLRFRGGGAAPTRDDAEFWAATRWVPTAVDGQLIAVYLLNGAFAAFVVVIAYGWARRLRTVARTAVRETAYYRQLFASLGVVPAGPPA